MASQKVIQLVNNPAESDELTKSTKFLGDISEEIGSISSINVELEVES